MKSTSHGFGRTLGTVLLTVSDSVVSTPEEFSAFLDGERAKWGAVIKHLGLTLE